MGFPAVWHVVCNFTQIEAHLPHHLRHLTHTILTSSSPPNTLHQEEARGVSVLQLTGTPELDNLARTLGDGE